LLVGPRFFTRLQTIWDDAQWTDLTVRFGDSNGYGVRMDIQTEKAYFRHGDQLLSCAALRRWITSSQRNPRYRESVVGCSIVTDRTWEIMDPPQDRLRRNSIR
jgi:hypothetical protein